jgi:cell filamentation protein
VYTWAGKYREEVRISKGGSTFCYPEHIPREMAELFEGLRRRNSLQKLPAQEFARGAAAFLATLNAIHAFRDGNGRSQLAFMGLVAKAAGHPLHFDRIVREDFLAAMIQSFQGNEEPLVEQITCLL